MKKITIELSGEFVLRHRNDEPLPIVAISALLEKTGAFECKDGTFTKLDVYFDDSKIDEIGAKKRIIKLLEINFPSETIDTVVTLTTSNIADDEIAATADEASNGEHEEYEEITMEDDDGNAIDIDEWRDKMQRQRRELILRMRGIRDEVSDPKSDSAAGEKKRVIEKIDELVGAAEFKSLAHELESIAQDVIIAGANEIFTRQSYLFSIGDGCGLSTYLELFAQLISELKFCKMAPMPVKELFIESKNENKDPFGEVMHVLANGSRGRFRVLCLDISEWMNKINDREFRQAMRAIDKHSEEFMVVFRVPFVEKDMFARLRFELADLMTVRAVSFPPFGNDEIKAYAETELKRFGFSVTPSAWKYFFERISEEKSDGKFYGISTVKKVVRELVYNKYLNNASKNNKSNKINTVDTKSICAHFLDTNLSGMELLNKLVGMDNIKKRIVEIVAQIELAIKNNKNDRPCIHMRFVGNPGTGKTTVARIVGKILNEKGILRVGAFFERGGRDFCGRYIGETAPKTSSICRDAYGSVLFIDEAYSLYRGEDDTRDFGREAIDTLIAEMENHRNDFVVIMAGYTDDMEKLMRGNAGLASRMPYVVEFPNFTREQLYEIFVSLLNERFKYESKILDAARKFFGELSDEVLSAKEFANARYVRNLFERTWAKAALRCQLAGKSDVVITCDDFEHAIAEKEFVSSVPKKAKIGFNIVWR